MAPAVGRVPEKGVVLSSVSDDGTAAYYKLTNEISRRFPRFPHPTDIASSPQTIQHGDSKMAIMVSPVDTLKQERQSEDG